MEALLQAVEDELVRSMIDLVVDLPYDSGELLSLWHEHGIVDVQAYGPEGIHVEGKVPSWLAGQFGHTEADEPDL